MNKNLKQPFKVIEIPLNKFTEEVVPHYQHVFEQHKTVCNKFIALNNITQLQREVKDKDRVIKQLKDLMYELDTLRAQVEDCDLDRFDTRTLALRKTILNLISGFKNLKATAEKLYADQLDREKSIVEETTNPFEGASQIQIEGDINDLKLKADEERLARVEAIEGDINDLHEMYTHLNNMVDDQKGKVDQAEESVESTNINVRAGLRQLLKANKDIKSPTESKLEGHLPSEETERRSLKTKYKMEIKNDIHWVKRLKASAYSMTGAVVGTVMAGPIGFVAGAKIGGLAAIGCALAGYTGGLYLKKINDSGISQTEQVVDAQNEVESQPEGQQENISQGVRKKDI